jgi:hypothetical protein
MNHLEIPTTRKNTKISFRTDEETLKKLKAIGRLENKTTSSLIENILTEHMLCQENPTLLQGEKRQSPRKQCSIPAVISEKSDGKSWKCIIINLSTSSMQVILKNPPLENLIDKNFYILFALPNHDDPFFFSCYFVRANFIHGECVAILNFECTEEDHEILKKYLADKENAHKSKKK